MGECGCELDVQRCNEHRNDVVVVFDSPEVARAVVDWTVGKRPGPYPEDIEAGRRLDSAVRSIRTGLRVQEGRGA